MRNWTYRDFEMDKPDQERRRCKFWLLGGKCQSVDAPKPSISSRCIGSKACNWWEKKEVENVSV